MPSELNPKDITDRREWRKVPSEDRIAYANKLIVLHQFRVRVKGLVLRHAVNTTQVAMICETYAQIMDISPKLIYSHKSLIILLLGKRQISSRNIINFVKC